MNRALIITSILTVLIVNKNSHCQNPYPDTLWFPVIFYDFHSDGSNPEFEQILSFN